MIVPRVVIFFRTRPHALLSSSSAAHSFVIQFVGSVPTLRVVTLVVVYIDVYVVRVVAR